MTLSSLSLPSLRLLSPLFILCQLINGNHDAWREASASVKRVRTCRLSVAREREREREEMITCRRVTHDVNCSLQCQSFNWHLILPLERCLLFFALLSRLKSSPSEFRHSFPLRKLIHTVRGRKEAGKKVNFHTSGPLTGDSFFQLSTFNFQIISRCEERWRVKITQNEERERERDG